MARIRTIKPEIWLSLKHSELPTAARLLHIFLWSIADNKNRVVFDTKQLKETYPVIGDIQLAKYAKVLCEAGYLQFNEKNTITVFPGDVLGMKRDPERMSSHNIKKWQRLRYYILHRDNYTCVYCGSIENLQVDHVIPVSKGGSDDSENLVASCRTCNLRKKDHSLQYFLNRYGQTK